MKLENWRRMMHFLSRSGLLVLAVFLLWGCGQKSPGLQDSAVAPDKALFENGMKFFDKNMYIKARLSFQTLINTYPGSEFTPSSFYAIADTYYEEAGKPNLLQAEAQYKDFVIFYPTHELADDAQMKVLAVNLRLMRPADRDSTYARKAEVEGKKLIESYPDSQLEPTAREILREVQESLAKGIHNVATFYFERGIYLASESRYKQVLEKYPDFSIQDVNLYKLGESLLKLGRIEEASVYYARIAAEYPFSEYFEQAQEKLVLFEKLVPSVNEAAAKRNQANRRSDSFSLLSPIRLIWQTFKGREDPYELARRRAEERKGQERSLKNDFQDKAHSGGE